MTLYLTGYHFANEHTRRWLGFEFVELHLCVSEDESKLGTAEPKSGKQEKGNDTKTTL